MGDLIRIAVVDDSRAIRNTLRESLNYSGKTKVVMTASEGNEMLRKLKACPRETFPEVVITDIQMPEMDGIELVRHGKALYPNLKFIMLTVADDEDTLFKAIQAGASGYLVKDEKINNIIAHIENLVESGSVPMSPDIARKTLDLLSRSSGTDSVEHSLDQFNLSEREQEVLQLLVEGQNYKEIAKRLFISPFTVRKHISNIYEKLHVTSKTQVIRLVHQSASVGNRKKNTAGHILLVDDHQMILDSLAMMITTFTDFEVVGKISDSRTVKSFLESHPVDLAIIDINMPYIDGLTLAGQLKIQFPELKIIFLTVSEDPIQIASANALGVDGYVAKKARKDALKKALNTVMRGERYFEDIA
jgi:DNA-binding NarL/FixJ family response regulator